VQDTAGRREPPDGPTIDRDTRALPQRMRALVQPRPERERKLLRLSAALLALAIFLVDILSSLEGAVAVLYVVVILLLAHGARSRELVLGVIACTLLTAISYAWSHGMESFSSATVRALVSIAAIAISAQFAFRNRLATETLVSQANMLNLSHDSIFVRDGRDVITFWSNGAEKLYGWSPEEARGQIAHDLLRTVYPVAASAIWTELTETGRWEGELIQHPRTGEAVTVHSRWALQRDERGQPKAVLQTETDVTERNRALVAITESERRYRTIFETSRFGILEEDWSAAKAALDALKVKGVTDVAAHFAQNPDALAAIRGRITISDVNSFMLQLAGAGKREAFPATLDKLLGNADQTLPQALQMLSDGETYFEAETVVVDAQGRSVPVLFGISFPEDGLSYDRVFVFVVDITERKLTQEALMEMQAELAHVVRVSTLGELTASIAHEVNQPLAAIVTNGEAALRWLRRAEPDLGEVDAALQRVVQNGKRAGEVVSRIRSYLKKTASEPAPIELPEIIEEARLLLERELMRNGVMLHLDRPGALPTVIGDRVQVQQVLINLIVNGIQAMQKTSGARKITVSACSADGGMVAIEVRDTGPGIAEADMARLFRPFFTTKQEGMGMGLAICRSIIEAHGGQLTAQTSGSGASFRFTLPASSDEAAT
jgi:PAS domain S-box-containing protein